MSEYFQSLSKNSTIFSIYVYFNHVLSPLHHASASSCVGQPAIVPQTFSLAYNLTGSSTVPSARSGAPGYVVGRPVLAGYAYADPAGTGKTAVLPLASGLRCGTVSEMRSNKSAQNQQLNQCAAHLFYHRQDKFRIEYLRCFIGFLARKIWNKSCFFSSPNCSPVYF